MDLTDQRWRPKLLSGLARAFINAKARALLVSHWAVSSDAAVKLTTKAFAELKAHQEIGRAEALRCSMVDLIHHGRAENAHPAIWAPIVLVGEGGAVQHETASVPPSASGARVGNEALDGNIHGPVIGVIHDRHLEAELLLPHRTQRPPIAGESL